MNSTNPNKPAPAGFKGGNGFLNLLEKEDLVRILTRAIETNPLLRMLLIEISTWACNMRAAETYHAALNLQARARNEMHGKKQVRALNEVSKMMGKSGTYKAKAQKIRREYGMGMGMAKRVLMDMAHGRGAGQPVSGPADFKKAEGAGR